ncbi:MAG TPA: hypothetical protein VLA25_01215, partial [Methylotenera sp.]|nr:hypothetical protein [Methylotenera sp.]
MKRLSLLLVAGLFSSNVMAAENGWTGFYLGGNLGAANAVSDSNIKSLGGLWGGETQTFRDFIANNASANQDPSGVSFGFQAGYDR